MTEALLAKLNEERYAVTLTPAELREIRSELHALQVTVAAMVRQVGGELLVPEAALGDAELGLLQRSDDPLRRCVRFTLQEPSLPVTVRQLPASADNKREERVPD